MHKKSNFTKISNSKKTCLLLLLFFSQFVQVSAQNYIDISLKEISSNGQEGNCPPTNGFSQDFVIAPNSGMNGKGIGWGANLYLQTEAGGQNIIYDLTWIIGSNTTYSGTTYTFDNVDIWMYEYSGLEFPNNNRPDVQSWSSSSLPTGVTNLVKVVSNGKIVLTDIGSECISATQSALNTPYNYSGNNSLIIYIEKLTNAAISPVSNIASPVFKHNSRETSRRRVCNWEGTLATPLNSTSLLTTSSAKKFARVVLNRIHSNRQVNKSCSTTAFLDDCTINNCTITSITPSVTSACIGDNDITFTKSPSNASGTFSSTPTGLAINATTGAINTSSSAAGTYTVTFTESTSCKVTKTITINDPGNASTVSVNSNGSNGSSTICSGEDAVFTISGTPGQIVSFTGVSATTSSPVTLDAFGKATITVTNATSNQTITLINVSNSSNSCSNLLSGSSNTATIVVNSLPLITAASNTICSGSSTTLTASGNTGSIQWQQSPNGTTGWTNVSGGSGATSSTYTTPNLTTTTYYRAVFTSGACLGSNSATVTITVNSTPSITATASTTTICSGSSTSISLNLNGSTSAFKWQQSTDGITWTDVTVSGATSSPFTTPNLTATTYYRAVLTNGACAGSNSNSVTIDVSPTSVGGSAVTTSLTICSGNSTTVGISGFTGSIQWQQSSDGITWSNVAGGSGSTSANYTTPNLTSTTYYQAFVTSGACSGSNSNAITVLVDPIVNAIPPIVDTTAANCISPATAIITNYSPSLTYVFSPTGPNLNSGTITNLTPGTSYTVVISNGTCKSSPSAAFIIDQNLSLPAIPTITITPATCLSDGKAKINNYSPAVSYNFIPNGPMVSLNGDINGLISTTNYIVTASNTTCTSGSSTAFSIDEQLPFPAPDFTIDNTEGCAPLNYNLSTTEIQGLQYMWYSNGNAIGNSSTISNSIVNGGYYDISLTISNALGCSATTTKTNLIHALTSPKALFTSNPKTINTNPQIVNFTNNSTGADSYLWNFGNGITSTAINPSIEFKDDLKNNFVTLHAYSNNGCVDSISIILIYNEETVFYIPNSFTPDQDEFNQTWGPVFTSGFDPFNFDMLIFNRWGNLIWESHDAESRWDGTYGANGIKVPQGIYTYKINYKPKENDKKLLVSGHINLIR